MVDLFTDSFDVGWDSIPATPTFDPPVDSFVESFDTGWDDVPPPVVEEQPSGRSFFIYRSCDLTATGTREALVLNSDILGRGIALIDSDSGLPAEETGGAGAPDLDVVDAEWSPPIQGEGTLPPGTYTFDGVPIDTCTGRTGTPFPLPALTINALGEVATLRVQFDAAALPEDCDGIQIRRDGVITGPVFPLFDNVPDQITVVDQPDPFGDYDEGTKKEFRRLRGADLIGGDVVNYNGFAVKVDRIQPHPSGTGQLVTFEPPIPEALANPPGFNDVPNRSGFYEAFSTFPNFLTPPGFPSVPGTPYAPVWPPLSFITWPGPLMSFKKIPPTTFGLLPFMDDLQPGDIIAYGSKTALVVYVENNPLAGTLPGSTDPQFGTVLCVPFGLLPLPPLPAGQFWIVYRAEITPTFFFYYTLGDQSSVGGPVFSDFDDPAFVTLRGRPTNQGGSGVDDAKDFLFPVGGSQNNGYDPADIPNERSANNAFRIVTFDVVEDPPASGKRRPSFLSAGQSLVYDGDIVTVSFVNEILEPDGLLPGEYEVEVTPGLTPVDFEIIPDIGLPGTPITIPRPVIPIGAAFTIPSFLSPFLKQPSIAPEGEYERVTRLLEFRTETNVWEYEEDGASQDRAGTVDGNEAKDEINDVFVQNNYPDGIEGLLDRVRGPRSTPASDVFVTTNGTLTRTRDRLWAVNDIAALGEGSLINLAPMRSLHDQLCDDASLFGQMEQLLTLDGFAIARLEPREVQVPAALCPPDQPDQREIRLFCNGFATTTDPLKTGELARVWFGAEQRFIDNQSLTLQRYGLTRQEAEDALALTTSGRVVTAEEVTQSFQNDIEDFAGMSTRPTDLDDILNDTRIVDVNTGTLNRPQIQTIIRRRGQAGTLLRLPETDPAAAQDPTVTQIDDFGMLGHRLAALTMQLQQSFDICDYDAALNSIEDPALRTQVAGFFAVAENIFNQLIQGGRALEDFLSESGFAEAAEAIASIIAASATDPTLSCLGGPQAALTLPGIPSFSAVDGFFADFAQGFQTRFNLSQLFGQAVLAVLCSTIGAFTDMVTFFGGEVAGQALKQAISCLPTREELLEAGVEFPSLEAQIAIECSLEKLNILLDIINALIAEANEIVDFGNNLQTGFVTQTVDTRNRMCSAGEGITSLVGGLRAFVGLG